MKRMLFKRRKPTQSKNSSSNDPSFDDGILDCGFYKTWYVDLQAFDNERLKTHWRDFGRKEERYPAFVEVLKSRNLDLSVLPSLFDWRYCIRCNPVLSGAFSSYYPAVANYL